VVEESSASGTWARTPCGYSVDVSRELYRAAARDRSRARGARPAVTGQLLQLKDNLPIALQRSVYARRIHEGVSQMGHFSFAPILCALAALATSSGCKGREPEVLTPASDKSRSSALPDANGINADDTHDSGFKGDSELFEDRQTQPFDTSSLRLAGKLDTRNRYSSTVMVSPHDRNAPDEDEEQEKPRCSGVLVGARHVLTTGHCVCPDLPPCQKSARVTTVVYSLDESGQLITSTEAHLGEVRPHPNLMFIQDGQGNIILENFTQVLDNQGNILRENTDLALVFLDKPVGKGFSPIMPARTELQANDNIIVVGYGHNENRAGVYGERRFKDYEVLAPRDTGKLIILKQPNRETYKGDSGGPCLREKEQGTALIGISTRGIGKEAACLRLDVYRSWLEDTIKRDLSGPTP